MSIKKPSSGSGRAGVVQRASVASRSADAFLLGRDVAVTRRCPEVLPDDPVLRFHSTEVEAAGIVVIESALHRLGLGDLGGQSASTLTDQVVQRLEPVDARWYRLGEAIGALYVGIAAATSLAVVEREFPSLYRGIHRRLRDVPDDAIRQSLTAIYLRDTAASEPLPWLRDALHQPPKAYDDPAAEHFALLQAIDAACRVIYEELRTHEVEPPEPGGYLGLVFQPPGTVKRNGKEAKLTGGQFACLQALAEAGEQGMHTEAINNNWGEWARAKKPTPQARDSMFSSINNRIKALGIGVRPSNGYRLIVEIPADRPS